MYSLITVATLRSPPQGI